MSHHFQGPMIWNKNHNQCTVYTVYVHMYIFMHTGNRTWGEKVDSKFIISASEKLNLKQFNHGHQRLDAPKFKISSIYQLTPFSYDCGTEHVKWMITYGLYLC